MRLLAGIASTLLILAQTATAAADDWEPKRDPFDRVVIARYEQLLGRDPNDPILGRLVDLYRRFRTVGKLVADYEAKLAATPDSWELVVITGRLRETQGDRSGALELYERAFASKPDVATAIRIGTLQRAAGNLAKARAVYLRALELDPKKQAQVLRALIDVSRAAGDRIDVALYANRLGELEPTVARTQMDRGDALAAIGLVAGAVDAYARAEALYGGDVSRKLDAIAARGRALEATRPADAEREYRRGIALAPKGYYLAGELFDRIVELHRARGTSDVLLDRALVEWPEARRGVYEWTQLARLYDATRQRDAGTAALAKAVEKSTDPLLHLQLVDRLADKVAALAVLDKLVARSARDVITLTSIAERYMRFGQTGRAAAAYRKIAQLDPDAEDRVVAMVEVYLKSDDPRAAIRAMRSTAGQLTKASSFARLGEVMLEWGKYREAADAFSQAIAREPKTAAYWKGRAAARDSLGQITDAIADAREVIRLTTDPRARQRVRKDLVRIAMHANGDNGSRAAIVQGWRDEFAADPPDIDAGALLVAYYEVAPCEPLDVTGRACDELLGVVDKLAQLEPVDVDQVLSIATAYSGAQQYEDAIELLKLLGKLAPDRRVDIDKHLAKVRAWYGGSGVIPTPRNPQHYWIEDPEEEIQAHREGKRPTDAIRSRVRGGIRLGAGAGLRGGADSVVTVGLTSSVRFARNLSIVTRLDWSERQGDHTVDAIGLAAGVGASILTTKNTTLTLGVAERLEQRWGKMLEADARTGLSADVTLDLVGRYVPVAAGVRFEQGLSQGGRATSLLFEIAVELR